MKQRSVRILTFVAIGAAAIAALDAQQQASPEALLGKAHGNKSNGTARPRFATYKTVSDSSV